MISGDSNVESGEPDWKKISIQACGYVLAAFVALSAVQFLGWRIAVSIFAAPATNAFGVSGDFFGFSNSVFSALAFAMIIVTLWMQKHELALQRQEISQTQEIINDQKTEMQRQADSLARQTFENTFFSMMELHNEVLSTVTDKMHSKKERSAFDGILTSLRNSLNRALGPNEKAKRIIPRYNAWYENNEDEIGHYFRVLYNILRFINESGLEYSERKTYARLVRAQLSADELELMFYNGLGEHGEKMKPLIEQYGLLKHLRNPDLLLPRSEYKASAYE